MHKSARRIIIGLFLLLPVVTFSQRFNGGLILGGLVSQVDGDNYQGYHKFGYLAGALVSLKVSEHSSFQMEMEYIQKGSRKNGDSASVNTYLLRLHYIEIPLLYQYSFLKRLSVEIGPAADISVGSYEESDGLEVENTVKLRPVSLSGIIGVSCDIIDHLKVNFRFNYSLISIRDVQDGQYPPGYRHILFETGQYNNVMSLSLIYKFKPEE
jgi:opacity protein-like surface antigen